MAIHGYAVREATPKDAPVIAALSGQLGYEVAAETMAERIMSVLDRPAQTVLVACAPDGSVVGWIEVYVLNHLISERAAVIAGLVVADGMRSLGIGRLLLERAEKWGREHGAQKMRVRSREARGGAHRFYEREGYKKIKTSLVFEKSIAHRAAAGGASL